MTVFFHWQEGSQVYPVGAWHIANADQTGPLCGEPPRRSGTIGFKTHSADREPRSFCLACRQIYHGYRVDLLAFGRPLYQWRVYDQRQPHRGRAEIIYLCTSQIRGDGLAKQIDLIEEQPGQWLYTLYEP